MSTAGQRNIPRRRDDNSSRVPWRSGRVPRRDQKVGAFGAGNDDAGEIVGASDGCQSQLADRDEKHSAYGSDHADGDTHQSAPVGAVVVVHCGLH